MNSWFGYSGDPVSCAAYDLCILDEIAKEADGRADDEYVLEQMEKKSEEDWT